MDAEEVVAGLGDGHGVVAVGGSLGGLNVLVLDDLCTGGQSLGGVSVGYLHLEGFGAARTGAPYVDSELVVLASLQLDGGADQPVVVRHVGRVGVADAGALSLEAPCRVVFVGIDDGEHIRSLSCAQGVAVGQCIHDDGLRYEDGGDINVAAARIHSLLATVEYQ